MSGPLPLALALIAVLALIGLAHVLGFSRGGVLSGPDHATALAQNLPGGFLPSEMQLAHGGKGAVMRDKQGRVAVVAPVGAHFLVREADPEWQVEQGGAGRLVIHAADFSADLNLGSDCGYWLAALVSLPGRHA